MLIAKNKTLPFCFPYRSRRLRLRNTGYKSYITFPLSQAQVASIQEESAKLQAAYAGDKAMEITNREREVLRAWMELQVHLTKCRVGSQELRFVRYYNKNK